MCWMHRVLRASRCTAARVPARSSVLRGLASTSHQRIAAARVAENASAMQDAPPRSRSNWPRGLLSETSTRALAMLPPDHVAELLYEVGWNAQHTFVDVREENGGATVRGALWVPFLPEVHTFEARVADALRAARRLRDPHDDDPKDARLVLGCTGLDGCEDARAGAAMLQKAGYGNAVVLDGGIDRWESEGLPSDGAAEEDIPDSTLP